MTTDIAQAKSLICQALMLLGDGLDTEAPAPSRLIRLPEVIEITGLKKSTIYRMIKTDGFPQPGKLGTRFAVWKDSAIRAWVDNRVSPGSHPDAVSVGARQRVAAYLDAFAAYAPTEDLDGEQIHWLGTDEDPRVLTVSDLRTLLAAPPPGGST